MIKKVKIIPGCVSCGTCQVICPQVFVVKEVASVIQDADLEMYEDEILEAAQMCPVGAIEIEKE
jgi:ferredoxin